MYEKRCFNEWLVSSLSEMSGLSLVDEAWIISLLHRKKREKNVVETADVQLAAKDFVKKWNETILDWISKVESQNLSVEEILVTFKDCLPNTRLEFMFVNHLLDLFISRCHSKAAVLIGNAVRIHKNNPGFNYYICGKLLLPPLCILRLSPASEGISEKIFFRLTAVCRKAGENSDGKRHPELEQIVWLLIVRFDEWSEYAISLRPFDVRNKDSPQMKPVKQFLTFRLLQRWEPILGLPQDKTKIQAIEDGRWFNKVYD
mmetsp:Transcript_2128/g.3032  ORF Transcript_2128/g.3032 Transcript_2128/m.3032 type:complete len:259 (-) Transcript_2128:271-1047(-)